jgi:hypothetical protein
LIGSEQCQRFKHRLPPRAPVCDPDSYPDSYRDRVLHFCGFKDKTKAKQKMMKEVEEKAMGIIDKLIAN